MDTTDIPPSIWLDAVPGGFSFFKQWQSYYKIYIIQIMDSML